MFIQMNKSRNVATIDLLMREIDRSLLRENLKLSCEKRVKKHFRALQLVEELRRAGKAQKQNGN